MVDTKTLSKQKSRIYHRNLSSVAPTFVRQRKFLTGRCMLSISRKCPRSVPGVFGTPSSHSGTLISGTKQGGVFEGAFLGNGRNTVSRVLLRRRELELTEPHWVLGQTRWVLRKTRWVRFGPQIIGWKELSEFAPRNSVSPKKLTEFGVWNRTPRNRIRPVSDFCKIVRLSWLWRSECQMHCLAQRPWIVFYFLGRDTGPCRSHLC